MHLTKSAGKNPLLTIDLFYMYSHTYVLKIVYNQYSDGGLDILMFDIGQKEKNNICQPMPDKAHCA